MTGFSADWLALREPADRLARDRCLDLLDPLHPVAEVVDLGAGTGANFRYLRSHLPSVRRWTLVDHDPALLQVAASTMPSPSGSADDRTLVETARIDLAAALDSVSWAPRVLVTASALLDLVSEDWLLQLVAQCRDARAPVLFALNYDGRARLWPHEKADATIIALVNQHQRTDKGFGPALGPVAAAGVALALQRAGYRVRRARSDWRIDSTAPALQAALLEGWAHAAREIAPHSSAAIDDWLRRRVRHLARGRCHLSVGHEDVVGWLPN